MPRRIPNAIAIALGITLSVFVFQVFGAWVTDNLALLFDSTHVFAAAGVAGMYLHAF